MWVLIKWSGFRKNFTIPHPKSGLSPALISVAGGWPRMGSGLFPSSQASFVSSLSSVSSHSISQTPASCIKVRHWSLGEGCNPS